MKRSVLLLILVAIVFAKSVAGGIQDTTIVKMNDGKEKTDKIIVIEKVDSMNMSTDTTFVRIGNKTIKVLEKGHETEIKFGNDDGLRKNGTKKFDGHWEGFEIGFNAFADEDYSMYSSGGEFMQLKQPKSTEISFNFMEFNIGLQEYKNNIGLVTGMGITFNNYRFDNPLTIEKGNAMVEPVMLMYDDLSKSKLTASFLNVPLLLEFQIPFDEKEEKLFVNAGIVGSVNVGSHTKIKYGDRKDKDRSSFYINPFRYAATARIGFKDISLYATYSFSPFFEDGKGPELTPFSIGISFLD